MWGWLVYWTACGAVKSITSFAMQFVAMSMHSRRVCAVTRNTTRGCAPKGTSFPGTEKRHWQDAGLEAGPHLDWRSLDLRPLSTHWASICSGAQGAAAFVCSRPMAGDDLSVGGAWLDRGPASPRISLRPRLQLIQPGDWQTASTKQPGVWDLAPAPVLRPMRGGLSEVTQTVYTRYSARGVWNRGRQTSRGRGVRSKPVQPCLVHQIAN